MRRTVIAALLAAGALTALGAAPAQGATGGVLVFSNELQPVTLYPDPGSGCQPIAVAAHILVNLTDAPIKVYADPYCLIPATLPVAGLGVLPPNYGTHVSVAGSFKAA